MDVLPRELQNRIVKEFDIETRLKCGIRPGKLKVPEPLAARLSAVLAFEDKTTIESAYVFKRFHESSDRKYMWYFADHGHTFYCMWRMNCSLDPRRPSYSSSDNRDWRED